MLVVRVNHIGQDPSDLLTAMACRASRSGVCAVLHDDAQIHMVKGGPPHVTKGGRGQSAATDTEVQPRGEAEEPPHPVPDWHQTDGQGSNVH